MTYKLVKLETLSEDYKEKHSGDEAGKSYRMKCVPMTYVPIVTRIRLAIASVPLYLYYHISLSTIWDSYDIRMRITLCFARLSRTIGRP